MKTFNFDIVVIGGGPAGLAALKGATKNNSHYKVALIERDEHLGGILKQCIHEGFGLVRYHQLLAGPEYAIREIEQIKNEPIIYFLKTFVFSIYSDEYCYVIECVNEENAYKIYTKNIIFATGCRERSAKQILIPGTNPSGVMTAGQAQNYVNLLGYLPGKNFVILGSGDIGLIMARRITLEGGHVLGVYEVRKTPSGLRRNIEQCLNDFNIPLYLSTTVTRLIGDDKLKAVEIAQVDQQGQIIESSKKIIECDALILSVGLIPENELAEALNVKLSKITNGVMVDQNFRSINNPHIFACGDSVHVFDLVDYCSKSGEIAGLAASRDLATAKYIDFLPGKNVRYVVPNKIDLNSNINNVMVNFRSTDDLMKKTLIIKQGENIILKKMLDEIKMAECQKYDLNLTNAKLNQTEAITVSLEDQ